MSGALPTSPGLKSVKPVYKNFVITSYSESGKQQSRDYGGTQKEFLLEWPIMTRAEFAPIFAFMLSQRGSYESWTFINPEQDTPQGTITGTALVNGAHSAGDNTIVTDGWTGTLKAGDIIKFNGHNLVYTVTADATGPATITIEPPLEEALINNEAITYTSVPYTVRMIDDVVEYNTTVAQHYRYSVKVVEAK